MLPIALRIRVRRPYNKTHDTRRCAVQKNRACCSKRHPWQTSPQPAVNNQRPAPSTLPLRRFFSVHQTIPRIRQTFTNSNRTFSHARQRLVQHLRLPPEARRVPRRTLTVCKPANRTVETKTSTPSSKRSHSALLLPNHVSTRQLWKHQGAARQNTRQ